MQLEYHGNRELLKRHKVGFLSSRQVGSKAVLPSYDWATRPSNAEEVTVGGFQTPLEQELLSFLLQSGHSVIVVLARKIYRELPANWIEPINSGQMLLISTAPKAVRVGREAALARNQFIATLCDQLLFGYIAPESSLKNLYREHQHKSTLLTPTI